MSDVDPPLYNIGAVARLSGVSREKIRIWERRYGAVTPTRDATNHRLYSREDIDRLTLIRRLVDAGHAVSSVAPLSLAALQQRAAAPPVEPPATQPGRALAVGAEAETLAALLTELGVVEVATASTPTEAEAWLQQNRADLVVGELPTLLGQDVSAVVRLRRRAPHTRLLVLYRFAPRNLLEQLRALDIHTARAPLQPEHLRLQPAPARSDAGPPADHRTRRFSAEQLHRAAALADTLRCECPRHLADLIGELNAFEDYSLGCEAQSPRDAALHREIYDTIARARALVEDALEMVASEERLEI